MCSRLVEIISLQRLLQIDNCTMDKCSTTYIDKQHFSWIFFKRVFSIPDRFTALEFENKPRYKDKKKKKEIVFIQYLKHFCFICIKSDSSSCMAQKKENRRN